MVPESLTLEWISYQRNSPEVRHQRPRSGGGIVHRQSNGRTGDVGRKAQAIESRLADDAKDHGHRGPQLPAQAQEDVERGRAVYDDDTDRLGLILLPQVGPQKLHVL